MSANRRPKIGLQEASSVTQETTAGKSTSKRRVGHFSLELTVSTSERSIDNRSEFASMLQLYRERIEALCEFGKDEGVEIRTESVDSFWQFVNENVDYRRGGLVLTDEGNLSVSWSEHPTDHVALEFLGGQEVGYVIFKGDDDDDEDVARVGGVDTMPGIVQRLEQIGLDSVLRE